MTKTVMFLLTPLVLISLFAYYIQTQFFLSPDVGYLLHAANQLLAGGNYGTDIIETNPPMILYIYLPACLLAKVTTINIITAIRCYILFLALDSSLICYVLLNKLSAHHDCIITYIAFYMILLIYLVLPTFEFGQRENILVIFLFPYLLSAALALDNKPISRSLACLIGLVAGLGFALKPFFMVTFFLIESYFVIKKQRLFAWIRPESIMVIIVLIAYLAAVFAFHAQYFTVILPIIFHFYFISAAQPWIYIFSKPLVIFCIAVLCSYYFFYKNDKYRTLDTVMALALFGMLIAFLIPRSAWFYHIYPALSLALFLATCYVAQLFSGVPANKSHKEFFQYSLFSSLAACLIFIVPLVQIYKIGEFGVNYKKYDSINQLISYINAQPGEHSIYCFSPGSTGNCFPLIYLTQSRYGGRYSFFWWYFGLKKKNDTNLALEKRFLLESVANDLNRYHARWIITDSRDASLIHYFSQNEKFRSAWQPYRYVTSIDYYQVYERKNV